MYDNMHFYMILKSLSEEGKQILSLYEYHAVKFLKLYEEEVCELNKKHKLGLQNPALEVVESWIANAAK